MSELPNTVRVQGNRLLEGSVWDYEITRLATGLELSTAHIRAPDRTQWSSISNTGVTIGAVVRGTLAYDLDGRGTETVSGPSGFVLKSSEKLSTEHCIDASHEVSVISLHLAEEFLEELRTQDGRGGKSLPMFLKPGKKELEFVSWKPSRLLAVMLRHMVLCPYEGFARQLYLQGKAFEIIALMAERAGQEALRRSFSKPSTANAERTMAARDILILEFNAPPSLDALARRVGMSTSLLTASFRSIFGMSINEFCQDYRLKQAFTALAEGNLTVSQAAYEAGYSPAYFSTLFRRKFGYPPSGIAGCRR